MLKSTDIIGKAARQSRINKAVGLKKKKKKKAGMRSYRKAGKQRNGWKAKTTQTVWQRSAYVYMVGNDREVGGARRGRNDGTGG